MFGISVVFSFLLLVLFFAFTKMQYGVDFVGSRGSVKFADGSSVRDLRASLDKAGFAGASVQTSVR